MRLFIATDMEGISGIDREMQVKPRGTTDYESARSLLMNDVNAAIKSALDSGATEVDVRDGHGGGGNFIEAQLHPGARFLQKGESVFERVDAGLLIGGHAMAGTMNAFLDHTGWHQHVFSTTINGRLFGEIGVLAARLGDGGAPLIMISGCEAACKEARDFVGELDCAIVKRAVGRNAARLVPEKEAHDRIAQSVANALSRSDRVPPFRIRFPADVVQVYCGTEIADLAMTREGTERIDARTVRKIALTADELGIL